MTRVLCLQQQPCIRTLKYAVGLRSTGRPFVLGFACQGRTLTEFYGTGDELFDGWWHLPADPAEEIERVVAGFRPDVVHCHNLPDRLTVVALDVVGGAVPVVHDVHDLQCLRQTPYEDGFPEPADPLLLEKEAVSGASAVVVVSEQMLEAITTRHGLPARVVEFANYATGRDLPKELPPPGRPPGDPLGVVYQGTLSTNGGHYDLRDHFRSLVAAGVAVHVYPGRPAPEYEDLAAATPGMTCHDRLPPDRLLQALPQYDFGWAGFNESLNAAHLDTALPNKAYEYLACGLPVLTLRHRALARLVEEEGVGLSLASVAELPERLRGLDFPGLRRRVADCRHRFTVEANIGRIVALYDDLAGGT
ncbi:MAG: glycosyltransferase [Acidimicrobiia bacterium]